MKPDRWVQIDRLLGEALDREPEHRKAFLEEACPEDADIRREVEALLDAHEKAGSFVQTPVLDLSAPTISCQEDHSLSGRKLGPYEILSLIGRGGMGEVYKALDTRLGRVDALKILPVKLAADPGRLRRFVREAKAASLLNHPNIATIYEIGESDGIHWIAMELVEGQTLAERIKERPLEVEEVLDVSIQAAEGLEAAHKKGIIHRDIKPANLMLTPEGRVKILDFGLAKIARPEGKAAATTVSESHDFPGIIIGTARYMSPEQVLGHAVDHRTDIFSLGVVLYEMVAGEPPFFGDTPLAVFDAILHHPPTLPPRSQADIPEELRRIINRALEKFREMRYQTAADLGNDLRQLKRGEYSSPVTASRAVAETSGQPVEAARTTKRPLIRAVAGLLALSSLAGVITWYGIHRSASLPDPQPTPVPLTSYPGSEKAASFSPDGNQVAFAWNGEKEDNWDIYVKVIGSESYLRLTTNKADDLWPAWSPDGRHIAFYRDLGGDRSAVVLISPLGGPERILTEVYISNGNVSGPFLSWSPDGGVLALVEQEGPKTGSHVALYKMETGERESLIKRSFNEFSTESCPVLSPDGRTLAFDRRSAWASSDLYLLDLSPDFKPVGEPRRLTFQGMYISGATWDSNGSALVYSAGGNLWRVAVQGSSQPQKLLSFGQDAQYPAICRRASRLAYTHSTSDEDIWRAEISSPHGNLSPPTKFISSTRGEGDARYSPDGKRIAFASDRSGSMGIWVCDSDGSNAIQLTHFGRGYAVDARWSPDSGHLAFDCNIEGHPEIYVVDARGGNPRRLTFSSGSENPSWSKDGRWIYFNSMKSAIQKVPTVGGPVELVRGNAPGFAPVESADGKSFFMTGMGSYPCLWRVPVEGGEPRQILASVVSYDAKEDGVYFIPAPDPATGYTIRFLDFATGRTKTVGALGNQHCAMPSVSPDRRWVLYTQTDQSGSDLMLVENFR